MNTCITVYSYGGMPSGVLGSYIDLSANIAINRHKAVLHTISDDALISRSRSRCVGRAIATNCDVWVQIDHDIEFCADDVFKLASIAMEKQAAVCVPYPCRTLPPRPAARPKAGVSLNITGKEEDVVPLTFIATGFCAIPMSCIHKTLEVCEHDECPYEYKVHWIKDPIVERIGKYPTLFKPMVVESVDGMYEYLSEDYSASARMTIAGVPQMAWLKPLLNHWGDFDYKMNVA